MNNIELIQKALDTASLRQKTISNNIANVNTAGYKVERVEFEQKLQDVISESSFQLERTNDKHLTSRGKIVDLNPEIVKREDTAIKKDGNNVDIDMEMSEKAVNELYYSSLTRQLNGEYAMLNYVINH
ncbi:flagellar basal body rod protein FlgB [Vagococcus salmoninarum]|uniref:flagellar basal body rod protein FlgB n=1 Tax=Vagococcus salmoninarum TaxID=2739 RepID=UPI0028D8DD3C|nr:flagellar basal body rod protein FlgB [Vagococcus salmoninarum]